MFEISVIIPSFNRASTIGRAIESVLGQTHKASEIIIVDDGSTDDTAEVIKEKYPMVTYTFQENAGVSAARNLGISKSSHSWLAFLDDDDEWMPHKLEKQVDLLTQLPDLKLCHTEERWIRNGVRVNQMHKHKKSGGWIYSKCLPLCAISPSSVLLHKSLFDDVGLFDEALPACEDYDMWLKICNRYPVAYVENECILKYGGHDGQLSAKYWGMDRFRIAALVNLLRANVLNEDNRRATLKMLQKKIRVYCKGAEKRNKRDEVVKYNKILVEFGLENS